MIAHIVLFRPRAGLTAQAQREFAEAFQQTCREVPAVRRAHIGKALPLTIGYVGDFDGRYTYSAVIEFDDQPGLLAYLEHPSHLALGKLFWKTCDATAIVDVQVADAKTTSLAAFLADSPPASKKNS